MIKRELDAYKAYRKEYTALTAFRFVKHDRETRAFFARMSDDNNDIADFSQSDLISTYVLGENDKRRLQVYIASYNDNDVDFGDDSPESETELYKYYRESAKLGKVQAREAVKRALERQEAYERGKKNNRFYAYGCVFKVFYDGKEISEDSCWGYLTDKDDFEAFASEIYGNAIYKIRDKIRIAQKAKRNEIMTEAFKAEFAI